MRAFKRFYVGAKHIGSGIESGLEAGCLRETLNEAVAEARQTIQTLHSGVDCLVIVKIVAIVRRASPPVEVTTFED